ncbi:nuclease-related domain-containing protein [Sphingobium sp. AntQ-1]|uniref:nuclease-related domain-containing protein n=1 Tax=Sphingobium sp. AntQ-1 TaxID=2930091 RepID=UPI00234E9D2D|nr:nuclease-related domain-containing protein [Sphingobium sp. AntQ-1]
MTTLPERLSEKTVTECLDALDWDGLRDHLDALTLDEESAIKLVGIVLRSRRLVFRYPGKIKKRKAIIDGVISKVRADIGEDAADRASDRLAVFDLVDEGYAGIRKLIDDLPLAGLSQTEQVSAYMARIARDWDGIRQQMEAASASASVVISGVVLETEDGERYGADSATSMFVNLLGMNISLAAHRGKWFDEQDIVRMPALPVATEEQIGLAGTAHSTALAWQQWQLIEERCCYMDGGLLKRPAAEDEGLPEGAQIIEHSPRGIEWEMLDTVANERLGERLGQTFQEMSMKTNLLTKGEGIDPGADMPPSGYVSSIEMHSVVMLSEFLGLNVATHPADLGGLRLCEWMRGFAVLQQLVNDRLSNEADVLRRAFPPIALDELEAILERNGLVDGRAGVFIDHASYAKSSRDLYDAPILRGEGDTCLLVGAALSDALLIRLVLSTLANKGLVIEGKGEAFEEQFRAVLETEGLTAYYFEVRRNGEVYEYDAVVPWGKYLFVFECKNRSLSGTNPIASYNLLRSTAGHAQQVQRLAQALIDHPDILTSQIKEDCAGLEIVPVIVNSMPFAMQGDFDGVYFSDVASINRFFSERYSHFSRLHSVGPHKVLHRVRLHDLWGGENADADAFMRHLEDPLQLRIMIAHMQVEPLGIQIGDRLYASTNRVRRKETTMESVARVSGMTAEAIEAEMERFASSLAEVREKYEADNPPAP